MQILTFLENYWPYGVFFLLIYLLYRNARFIFSFKKHRPMHWSTILLATCLVCYSGAALILRHPSHQLWVLLAWSSTLLVVGLVSFLKAMKIHIQLNEKKQILVPSFFFKFTFCVVVPYSVILLFIFYFHPNIYQSLFWVVVSACLKGVVAGVYLGACVASIYQVYERDMPS